MGLTYSSVVRAEPDEVFAWHSRVGAITRLMPPWQPVRVAWEAPSVRDGQAVLVLPGGLRWVAGHDPASYDPPRQFADVLLPPLGKALRWRHTHSFTPADAGGTAVVDVVSTPVPSRVLRPMFEYRHRQLAADLAAHARARNVCPQPLTVALTGASGLIGSALVALLTTGGHRAIKLVRRAPRHPDEREWTPEAPDPELLAGVDAVVHLAGASIGRRFTEASKREMLASRTGPTRALATLAAGLPGGPRAFVSAAAVGFYGADRGDEILTEDSERGDGFLADVAAAWEDPPPGHGGGSQDGPGPHRHRADPARRDAAPAVPAVRGRPRRPARQRYRVAALDRDRRPARHLPARGHRPRARRSGQRGRARRGAQRRVREHPRPGAPQALADPRPARPARGCCSAPKAPGKLRRPASGSARRRWPAPGTCSGTQTWRARFGMSSAAASPPPVRGRRPAERVVDTCWLSGVW